VRLSLIRLFLIRAQKYSQLIVNTQILT